MDKKTFNEKRFFFLTTTFFFFIAMFFLYLNVSNIMYTNAGIILSIKTAKNLQYVWNNEEFQPSALSMEEKIKKLNIFISSTDFYPPYIYLKIYSPERTLLYQTGEEVELEHTFDISNLIIPKDDILYNKTLMKEKKKRVYEVLFSIQNNKNTTAYIDILFDLEKINELFFNEKQILFLIIFIINLLILIFLIMMILNLQKRLFCAEEEINHLNTSDKTTGLLTKEAFFHKLKNEIERMNQNGGKLSMITADIDNFLTINEKCGYEFGDHILKTISSIFQDNFRIFDLIGRFGGDEIVAVMIESTEEESFIVSEKCRLQIEETKFFYEGIEIPVTMSLGISSVCNDTPSSLSGDPSESAKRNLFRNLLFDSLNALSRAKRNGKNQTIKHENL